MRSDVPESLEPRVASLETAVRNISQGVADLGVSIGALRTELASRGRINIGAVTSVVGVAVVLVGAIGTAWIAPIRVEMEFAKLLFQEERAKRQKLTEDMVAQGEMFKEVETQFRWSRAANSFAFNTQQRLVRMLWQRVYGEELPALESVEVGANGK